MVLRSLGRVQEQLGFDFGNMPRKLVRVTPAKLANWADCPRRYRMAYLDRPSPPRGGAWAHNTLGAVVHNALKALFDLPASKRTPDQAVALVHRQWKNDGFKDAEQASQYRQRADGWVRDYVSDLDTEMEPVGIERWVSTPTSKIVAEGRVDRIDLRDGELVIVDYKTGRRAPDEYEARGSQALALYAVAGARTLRKPCHRVELHHLPSGTVAAAEHTAESLQRQLLRAEETALELQLRTDTLAAGGDADELFPVRTGRHCAWCDFRPSCPEGRQAAPEAAKSWELLAP